MTTRLLSLVCIALIATALAQAQGDPHAEATAKVNALVKSGDDKTHHQDFDGAIADFNEALKAAKSLPVDVQSAIYMSRGLALERQGKLDAALADMNKAVKLQSNNFYAYQDRADLHEKRKEFDQAISDYSQVIKLSSRFPFAYRGRGLILLRQGKDADAEADFAKYLQLFASGKDSLEKEIQKVKEERAVKP